MEPTQAAACHEVIDHDEYRVHQWRVTQLQIASLVQHGCPPRLALRIIR